ncbi:MAG: mannose-1-phosphate guanylyltransferase [Rhodothermales bacterium]|nr:mannose-1-phosphate guanylyltransferase [Rhodothermales bacterium]
MLYAVILAGGVGSRFWPQSRQSFPKQFLSIGGERTLIQDTVDRLDGLVPPERVFVVTGTRYLDETRRQLPEVPEENLLAEPLARNTAPAIAFAAAHLYARDPDATLVVLPADHVVTSVSRFHEVLDAAIEQAQTPGALVTIGIAPTHPETGYGYLQFDGTVADAFEETPTAFPVLTFAEKPDLATAENFVDSGDFLWNAGMFVWRADSILDAVASYQPELDRAMRPFRTDVRAVLDVATVEDAFAASPKISIDYAVMERAEGQVFVVPGAFGWSDVGDWRAVYTLSEKDEQGNAVRGRVILQDSSRCHVAGNDRLVVLVGMNDAVVVDTDDALLILHREAAQQVKNVVDYLHANGLDQYV